MARHIPQPRHGTVLTVKESLMAHPARRPPCPQCKRRRQRIRAHSPLLNTFCMPISRWGFTLCALGALYAGLTIPTLLAGALAGLAWRYA